MDFRLTFKKSERFFKLEWYTQSWISIFGNFVATAYPNLKFWTQILKHVIFWNEVKCEMCHSYPHDTKYEVLRADEMSPDMQVLDDQNGPTGHPRGKNRSTKWYTTSLTCPPSIHSWSNSARYSGTWKMHPPSHLDPILLFCRRCRRRRVIDSPGGAMRRRPHSRRRHGGEEAAWRCNDLLDRRQWHLGMRGTWLKFR